MTEPQQPQTGQDSDECPCHMSREELEAATASLQRCLDFATATESATLQDLLTAAIANNQGSDCPPVVLNARGPHIVPPGLECDCHQTPEELEAATASLQRCLDFATATENATLQDLLTAAIANNQGSDQGSDCPPVVLNAQGPH